MMGKIYYLNKEEFLQLANKGNLVPVYCKILADTETSIRKSSSLFTSKWRNSLQQYNSENFGYSERRTNENSIQNRYCIRYGQSRSNSGRH